jgi:uncharacterized protein YfaQ (DUF2300 family)
MKSEYCLPGLALAIVLVAATSALGADPPCDRHTVLEGWLAARAGEWDSRLAQITGYERPGPLSVCRVAGGGPRSEGEHIYLPPLPTEEEMLSLTHEYVHLAFVHHPVSRNEGFVERTARALLMGEELR